MPNLRTASLAHERPAMITVKGRTYRTLNDNISVNGKKVTKVTFNGTQVYPDEEYKYYVDGVVTIDLLRTRAYSTWVMPDWWNAEVHVDVRFHIESKLPIYRSKYDRYDTVLLRPVNIHYITEAITFRGYATGKTEAANFGSYIAGHWGATQASEWYRRESNQTSIVERSSPDFGSEDIVLGSVYSSEVGVPNINVDGTPYSFLGVTPAITLHDMNHGTYTVMWPDEQVYDAKQLRVGWNGSETYSTFNGGHGDAPGSIMTRNSGTCKLSGSPSPWATADEWAAQWLKEYHALYG